MCAPWKWDSQCLPHRVVIKRLSRTYCRVASLAHGSKKILIRLAFVLINCLTKSRFHRGGKIRDAAWRDFTYKERGRGFGEKEASFIKIQTHKVAQRVGKAARSSKLLAWGACRRARPDKWVWCLLGNLDYPMGNWSNDDGFWNQRTEFYPTALWGKHGFLFG